MMHHTMRFISMYVADEYTDAFKPPPYAICLVGSYDSRLHCEGESLRRIIQNTEQTCTVLSDQHNNAVYILILK